MDAFCNSQLKRRKHILSTRRKMKVLAALNFGSRNCLCDERKESGSYSQKTFDNGKEIMSFLQSEQLHVECLKNLKKCLIHPALKGAVEALDDILGIVDEMISRHSNIYSSLIFGKSDVTRILVDLSASFDTYVSYSVLINIERKNFQKLSETVEGVNIDFDLLQEPITHISRYKTHFQNLCIAEPNDAYHCFLKSVEIALKDMQNALSLRKNAIRTLQIQKFLIKREPKILSPGRTVLKEGVLYKVNAKGKGIKERVFFLFNDIFLCCKILSKTADWHKKDSLLFKALFPLNMCFVDLVLGSEKQGALFKVTCGTVSYLLISKIPGEAQSWFRELQAAVRMNQKPALQMEPKLNRQKLISLKYAQRINPFLKKPVRFDINKKTVDIVN